MISLAHELFMSEYYTLTLKGNCSKKIISHIPSIDRVCGTDAQGKT